MYAFCKRYFQFAYLFNKKSFLIRVSDIGPDSYRDGISCLKFVWLLGFGAWDLH